MLTGVSVMKKMGFQIALKTRNIVSSSDHNWKIIPCSSTSDGKGPSFKLSRTRGTSKAPDVDDRSCARFGSDEFGTSASMI